MEKIKTYSELFKLLQKNNRVTIRYRKKDGSSRNVNCTLNFEAIPKDKYPKSETKSTVRGMSKRGLIVVFDLDKNSWKSLITNNISNAKVGDDEYEVG